MRMLSFQGGDQMPSLGLGTWKSKPGEVGAAVKEALRIGYRHLDCAVIYGNEKEIGAALSECFAGGLVQRDELWVTSKLWNDKHDPSDVRGALETTLADLQLEYLDLYLMHWPVALRPDGPRPMAAASFFAPEEMPIAATWEAMAACAQDGLAKHLGVSNFSVKKLSELHAAATHKPEANQVEMHPYLAQPQLVQWCKEHDVHLTAYSPLGSPDRPAGMMGKDEQPILEDKVVLDVAGELGASPAQVLLAWAMQRGTSVIPKSVNAERLAQNLAAAELELSTAQMSQLNELDARRRYITGEFWCVEGGPWTVERLWDE